MERYVKLAVAVAGIYTCYLSYGIFQEELYRKSDDGTRFSATAFVLFVQCVTNAVIALMGHFLSSAVSSAPQAAAAAGKQVDAPAAAPSSWWWTLLDGSVVATSIVYVLAMYTSNEALAFVPYTTQALVKSCKMIPVLLGSIVIARKRYSLVKYLAVLMMTAGITWFQFAGAGSKHKPAVPKAPAAGSGSGSDGASDTQAASIIAAVGPEAFGMLLLCASLCLDGITGPTQELLKRLKLTNMQQMLGNNVWASLVMLGIAAALGQVQPAVAYLSTHPHLLKSLALFSLCSAFGQIFIFWTIRTFDALTLSTITTTRKFFTIVMSVFYFKNPMTPGQWGAVGVVFAALVLEMLFDDKKKHGHGAAAATGHQQHHHHQHHAAVSTDAMAAENAAHAVAAAPAAAKPAAAAPEPPSSSGLHHRPQATATPGTAVRRSASSTSASAEAGGRVHATPEDAAGARHQHQA